MKGPGHIQSVNQFCFPNSFPVLISLFSQSFSLDGNSALSVTHPGIKMHHASDRQGNFKLEKTQESCQNIESLSVPGTGKWQQHENYNYSGPEIPSAALRMCYSCEEMWIQFLKNGETEERNKQRVFTLSWNRSFASKHWKPQIMWAYKNY